jgi:oligoendopeptidase F
MDKLHSLMTRTSTTLDRDPLPSLPRSPSELASATWADIAPLYEALALNPPTLESALGWLARWTELEELVGEAAALAAINYTCDTNSAEKEQAHLRFAAEIAPLQNDARVRLAQLLLDTGFSQADLETTLSRFRADREVFRSENIPLYRELEELETGYNRVSGDMTAEWEGARLTLPQLQPFLKDADREVRKKAFMAAAAPFIQQRNVLADNFDECYERRQRLARNAGFSNYQEYAFRAKYRFDYSPDDTTRFHDAVEEAVVPAVQRLNTHRREALGLETLRPWDLAVNVGRDKPLVPFATAAEFVEVGKRIFAGVDGELGEQFRSMADEGLLDLESRPGKAPGGYCTTLPWRGKPFVFMNAVGVPDDVNTLVHEAGHCFHDFAMERLPYYFQRNITMEAAELASMSMELLAAPFLAKPIGYYDEQDVAHAWLEHLEDIPASLCHIASVDAFQSWIYTSGSGGDRDARDESWLLIRQRFENSVDWSGLRSQRLARWYKQSHIFLAPFYYIEYGIAQLGALQVWRNSLADYGNAVAQYKSALSLGATRPLGDIYAAMGARTVFDAATMKELMDLVEENVHQLRQMIASGDAATR